MYGKFNCKGIELHGSFFMQIFWKITIIQELKMYKSDNKLQLSLLNENGENLEDMILWFHKAYGVVLPRRDLGD